MIEAYLLIQNEMGAGSKVAEEVRTIPGVLLLHSVTGPYDLVARVEASELDALSKLVDEVQLVPGVTRTMTCPVVKL
jgi:DNA-binding Lrp family transcriptional regulator